MSSSAPVISPFIYITLYLQDASTWRERAESDYFIRKCNAITNTYSVVLYKYTESLSRKLMELWTEKLQSNMSISVLLSVVEPDFE